MKRLSPEATAIMQEILAGISNIGDARKLNNNSSFMPLYVECIGEVKEGKLFSLAHLRDPEMVFLERITPQGMFYYPVSYRNDYAMFYSKAIFFKDSKAMLYPDIYNDQLMFAETWLKNIQLQQLSNVTIND